MGVAVPMSMPGYRSYLGRQVEISCGGKSVIATVNDCGGMGGGSRVLDLRGRCVQGARRVDVQRVGSADC